MRRTADNEDVLGFCTQCIRMRWLRVITSEKIPSGLCRQCDRENNEGESPQ